MSKRLDHDGKQTNKQQKKVMRPL